MGWEAWEKKREEELGLRKKKKKKLVLAKEKKEKGKINRRSQSSQLPF